MESTPAMPVCTSKKGKWLTHTHLLQEVGLLRSTGQGLDVGVKPAHLLQGSLPALAVKGGNRHLPTAGGGKAEGGVNLGEGLQQSLRNRGEETPTISSPRHCSFSGRTSRPGLVHRLGPAARHVTIMHLASTSTPKEISKYNPDCGALFR